MQPKSAQVPKLNEETKTGFNLKKGINRYFGNMGLLVVILVFGLILSILSPVFLTTTNLVNLLIQSTILACLALGVTFVIITGGIDLSVGSVMAISVAVGLGSIVNNGMPIVVGVIITLLIGVAFGLLNGIVISKLRVPPLIVTLATMGIARGAVLIYTNGSNIHPVPASFVTLATGRVLGIPYLVIMIGLLCIIAYVILSHTVYGRSVYASGGNELAARLAGVKTKTVVTFTYVISGLLAAVAGILLTARLESAGPTIGEGIELTVIAAVVIGGTSLFGGQGSILGTILGVLLITLVSNAVNLLGVPPAWDELVKGVVILIAALLDVYRRKYSDGKVEV
ncbi:ABC transporter permease [Peribacillus frigoritolerans]|uniref:ABC transporter permease n=1 Tax=Peribacillus frigoritolerans TaxID=450367 RepID=UPI002416CE81|nr:ABC transporter permease [Peribacillus frigoritolerans]MDG4850344.1 ABC transporter permease [Peribacillus frigoritolerans]